MRTVTAKLGNMRKAVEWTVYPKPTNRESNELITIQSDSRIAEIHTGQKKAMLSKHRSGGAYFLHLHAALGATVVPVSDEIIAAVLAAQPKSGDKIHGVLTIA